MTELLFRDDAYLREIPCRITAAAEGCVEFDRTIFYPLGGGQPGDRGWMVLGSGERLAILDTRKGETPDRVRHVLAADAALPAPGTQVQLQLDWPRRHRLMRMHTAMHVMASVIPAPVTGGNIGEDRARIDFDIDMALLDGARIERETNALIARAVDTRTLWITDEELDAQPELVRTLSVKPPRGAGRVRLLEIPGIDLQPCGGTHVHNIGEIIGIHVLRISNQGKQNKRVEFELLER